MPSWVSSCCILLFVSNALAFPLHDESDLERQHSDASTYITGRASSGDVIGEIKLYAGDASHLPATWMLCHGQALSRTQYDALFSVIGGSFGSGDGTSTFNLPDLRSRFVMGRDPSGVRSDAAMALGQTGGQTSHTLTVDHLPVHSHASGSLKVGESGLHAHDIRDPGHKHKFNYGHWDLAEGKKHVQVPIDFRGSWGGLDGTIQNSRSNLAIKTAGSHLHSLTGNTGSIGDGDSFSLLNPYQTLDYIIFTGMPEIDVDAETENPTDRSQPVIDHDSDEVPDSEAKLDTDGESSEK